MRVKRFFWKTYYRFWEPVTKSDIVKAYCRTNGFKCVDVRVSALDAASLRGLPDFKKPPYCFERNAVWKA